VSKFGLPIETIRQSVGINDDKGLLPARLLIEATADQVVEDCIAFSEGTQFYSRHLEHERSAALVNAVKEKARKDGLYFCQVCKADFQKIYGIEYIECHHTKPVSTMSPGEQTKLEDVVLLCANCHRAVHKQKPWLQKHELHKLLLSGKLPQRPKPSRPKC
jgi:predicted HNH restriction endonuclease